MTLDQSRTPVPEALTLSPCPPGVPLVVPGEGLEDETSDCRAPGVRVGMYVPDAADGTLVTVRVVAVEAEHRPGG
jgi:arginine/lysine/ornithine decarboxylase